MKARYTGNYSIKFFSPYLTAIVDPGSEHNVPEEIWEKELKSRNDWEKVEIKKVKKVKKVKKEEPKLEEIKEIDEILNLEIKEGEENDG